MLPGTQVRVVTRIPFGSSRGRDFNQTQSPMGRTVWDKQPLDLPLDVAGSAAPKAFSVVGWESVLFTLVPPLRRPHRQNQLEFRQESIGLF